MHSYKSFLFLILFIFAAAPKAEAQTVNWSRMEPVTHHARIYSGLDYGLVYGLNYGRVIKAKSIVWMPFVDASLPMGNQGLDDYRLSVGTLAKVFDYKNWIASLDVSIVGRQNRNPFVRMNGLGSESGIHLGYYKEKWFVNIQFSTDNSYLTYFKHTEAYKGNFPDAKDAWYQNTANNQYFGLNAGYSFKKVDITLSSGLRQTDGLKTKLSLPMSLKLGVNYRL